MEKKKWTPKGGEKYWYIDSDDMTVRNSVFFLSVEHNTIHDNRIRINNCFKTKEEAETMADKIRQVLNNY